MVTFNNEIKSINGKTNAVVQGVCLSSDSKPTDVGNGSILLEMDTGKTYAFNAEGEEWIEVSSSGSSGGGGGDSDFSTAQVTIQGDGASEIAIIGCFACHVPGSPHEYTMMPFDRFGEALVLYKGASFIQIDNPQQRTISVSGNIEDVDGAYFVTGDFTITANN